MDILSSWTKAETLYLIKEFKKHSILYEPQNPGYFEVNKKREAIKSIVDELKDIKPNIDVKAVKMKLKTLRQQLTKERNKILSSERSGASTSRVYKPTLWCFDELSFLLNVNEECSGVSNISEIANNSVDEEEDCARDESQPVNHGETTECKQEGDIEMFVKTADRSLQLMEKMTTNTMQLTKEEAFCQYICSELKSFKLEESFDSVQMAVVMSIQAAKAKERAFFRPNEMWKSSPPPSPSNSLGN